MAEQKWLVEGPKTIDVEGADTLKVGLIGGQVDVVAHDEPGIRIEVHSVSGKPLKISVEGGTVEIDHPQLSWDNWLEVFRNLKPGAARADVSVMVPRAIAVKLGVVNASALVTGVHGDTSLSTVSGDITADSIVGDLQLNSVSGELAVRQHTGRITAHTVSGAITATGPVRSFTSDGVSGEVFLDLAGVPDEVRVNTVSGRVTARLEPGVAVSYTINTVSGRLQLDDSEIRGVHGRYTGKHGELDRHWLDFRANTVSGDVSVLHAVASPSDSSPA